MSVNITQTPTTNQAGQSQSAWAAQAAANGWSNPQQLLSMIMQYSGTIAPSENNTLQNDPTLQKLVDQGYLQPFQDANSGVTTYSGQNIPQSAGGWAPAFFQGTPKPGGGTSVIDPRGVTNDPLYGSVTSNANMYTAPTALDKFGPMIPLLFAALPGMLESGSLFASNPGLSAARTGWSLTQGVGNGSLQDMFSSIFGGGNNSASTPATTATTGGSPQLQQLMSLFSLLSRLGKGGTTSS